MPNVPAPTTGIGDLGGFTAAGVGVFGNTAALDTTVNQTLDITVQWSAASVNNSFRMRYAVLELV